jgi:hypothetical protein
VKFLKSKTRRGERKRRKRKNSGAIGRKKGQKLLRWPRMSHIRNCQPQILRMSTSFRERSISFRRTQGFEGCLKRGI